MAGCAGRSLAVQPGRLRGRRRSLPPQPPSPRQAMRAIPIGIALLVIASLPALPAGPTANAGVFCGRYVRWAEHHDPGDARFAITTEDGKVTLLLTDRVVALQLSERTLHRVQRELHAKEERQDHWLGAVIASAVIGTVGDLLDSSFECRLSDLRD